MAPTTGKPQWRWLSSRCSGTASACNQRQVKNAVFKVTRPKIILPYQRNSTILLQGDTFADIFEQLASRAKTSCRHLLMTLNDRTITSSDTPLSIGLSAADIIGTCAQLAFLCPKMNHRNLGFIDPNHHMTITKQRITFGNVKSMLLKCIFGKLNR